MKDLLQQLFEHKPLSKAQAYTALRDIATKGFNDALVASFLTVYMMRSITVEELEGFRDALLELCIHVDLGGQPAIDMCGTGGDGKNTFNISTTAMFIAAGAGIKIAKHGNYGVSSASGSSNVLQALGYMFTNEVSRLQRSLEHSGVCFMHAPLFHPAMKAVAPIRAALGMKTFFNMLGPLVNPAFPSHQLTGVFSMELMRLYVYLLQQHPTKQYIVLRSLDGYDEISLTGEFKIASRTGEQLCNAQTLGFRAIPPQALRGGDSPEESAEIFLHILNGEGTPEQNAVVCANAGMALHCMHPERSMTDCVAAAQESLASKRALAAFQAFMKN